ncbi:hypothetical protein ACGFWD_41115 [Streptomyces sp. NPDC048448]|uniref:hypothetical protein n=1 Tax=unclassified Streptomyces TaxID=2593676 RepID=UPI0034252269
MEARRAHARVADRRMVREYLDGEGSTDKKRAPCKFTREQLRFQLWWYAFS